MPSTSSDLASAVASCANVLERAGVPIEVGRGSLTDLEHVAHELPLSEELRTYFADVAPVESTSLPWTIERLRLFSVTDLVVGQNGYRWVGPERVTDTFWPASWVVIGEKSGDPFIADTSVRPTPVLVSVHGMGEWRAQPVASSIAAFYNLLAVFFEVLLLEYRRQVWDHETGALKESFVADLRIALAPAISEAEIDAFLMFLE